MQSVELLLLLQLHPASYEALIEDTLSVRVQPEETRARNRKELICVCVLPFAHWACLAKR